MSMQRQGKRIGLTGGIGAGKSAVSAMLRESGVCVLDADEAARAVVEKASNGLRALQAHFGAEIIQADGSLDRAALAKITFQSAKKRAELNAILHPLIGEWLQEKEAAHRQINATMPVVWDAALLIEAGLYEQMDEVWVVVADDEVRLQRILRRDHCTEGQALARMKSQMPQDEKLKYAHKVIQNSGTFEELRAQVEALQKEWESE